MSERESSSGPGGARPDNIHWRVWRLSWPMILANLTVPLPGIVDTAVLGNLEQARYLGALAIGNSIFMIVYYAFGFLRMGTAGFTAQAYGAEDYRETLASLARALGLGLGLGLSLIVLQGVIEWAAFLAIRPEPVHEQFAGLYFRTRIWSAPAVMANFAILGWLIAMQRTNAALVMQVLMNGLNISLDFVFVYGLDMAVDGVALATVIADYFALIPGIYFVQRRLRGFGLGLGDMRRMTGHILDGHAIAQLFRVNGDIFVRTLFLTISFAILPAIGARLGKVIVDVNAVLFNFIGFMSFGLDAFAFSAEALVGKAKGAKDRAQFRAAVFAAGRFALGFAVLFTIFYALSGPMLIDLITAHEGVRARAYDFLPWAVACPVVAFWCFHLDGVFIGSTRSRDLRNMMALSFAVYIACLTLAVPAWGNHGLWFSLLVFFAVRGVTLAWRYPALERSVEG